MLPRKLKIVTAFILGQTGLAFAREMTPLGETRLAFLREFGVLGQTKTGHVWPNTCSGHMTRLCQSQASRLFLTHPEQGRN